MGNKCEVLFNMLMQWPSAQNKGCAPTILCVISHGSCFRPYVAQTPAYATRLTSWICL